MSTRRARALLSAACLVSAAATQAAAPSVVTGATGQALQLVGHNDLGARGLNAALAIGDTCAYIGSRNDAAPLVVDIADATHPSVVGALRPHAGSTPRELRAVASQHLLAVMFFALTAGGTNRLDLYHWGSDCRSPALVGGFDFGAFPPHEFYLWQDPAQPSRILIFQSFFSGTRRGLQVIDVSEPTQPRLLGTWALPNGLPADAGLHSIALSADGRTAYLSMWTAGLVLADSSDFVTGKDQPQLRLLTPLGSAVRTPPGNVHSAVAIPGRAVLLTTDEIYPRPGGSGCPYGPAHLIGVSDAGHPRILSSLAVPENQPQTCAASPLATWTSHNPTLTQDLALISWYSAGLQVFDVSDAAHPVRLAEYRADLVKPRARDVQLFFGATLTWSYPVIHNGLVYVVDVNQGLLVLRYQGPFEQEISGLAAAEGNSNLTQPSPHAAATGSPLATASASPRTATPVAPPGTIASSAAEPREAGTRWWLAGAALATIVISALLVLRRRTRGPR